MEKSAAQPAPAKIHALTSLRFFAALYVVCFHALSVASFLPSIRSESFLGRWLGLGYTSVSFFFLLSGYILGVVYLRRGSPVALGAFFRARFARIYPLLFLSLVVDIPYFFNQESHLRGLRAAISSTASSFAGCALLLQAWTLHWRFLNEPSWSLSAETIFYLSFPFLGIWCWKLRGVRLWATAAILYLGGQAIVTVAAQHAHGEMVKRLPLLHMTTFALGILLARWQTLEREKTGVVATTRPRLAYLALVVVLIYSAAVIYWSPQIPVANIHDGLLAPVFLCVIWAFSQSSWHPAKLLSAPWLVLLGEASYGLYLIHMPVFHLFEWLGWDRIPELFPVYVVVSIGLSVVSFYWFETPARRWLLKGKRIHVKETMEMASDAQ
jgi:peptidoglycan/LPS O-acetylase OafA/YrhL